MHIYNMADMIFVGQTGETVLNMKIGYAKKQPVYIFTVMALGLPNAISTLLSDFANSFANQLLPKYGSDSILLIPLLFILDVHL